MVSLMSYVERTVYDYLKDILTSGIRILLSKRFFVFTLMLFLSSILPMYVLWQYSTGAINIISMPILAITLTAQNIVKIQFAISLAFIIVGFLLGRANTLIQSILIIVAGIIFSVVSLYFIEFEFIETYELVMLSLWTIILIAATFSFVRNLFGNKISGSILFLGKPENQGFALFGGLLAVIYIIFALITAYIYLNTNDIMFLITNLSIQLFMILAVTILARFDDLFFTIVGFYYLLTAANLISLGYQVLFSGSNRVISIIDVITAVFFIIYNVQIVIRKIPFKRKAYNEQDVWIFSKVFEKIGEKGVVLIFFGIVLGYVMWLLTLFFVEPIKIDFAFFNLLLDASYYSVFTKTVYIYFANLILLVILLLYVVSPSFRNYSSPKIYRFSWLPPYDELKKLFERAREEEISWKELILKLILKGLAIGSKQIYEMARESDLLQKTFRALEESLKDTPLMKWLKQIKKDENEENLNDE